MRSQINKSNLKSLKLQMFFIHKHVYKETNIIGYYYKYDLYSQLKNQNLFYFEGIFWSICAFLYKEIQIIKYIFLRSVLIYIK